MSEQVFVYVIGPKVGPQKIGIARDIRLRLETLQVGCPLDLIVHHAEVTKDKHEARRIERLCHRILSANRRRGEWFDVSPQRAAQTVRDAIGEHSGAAFMLETMRDANRLTWAEYEAAMAFRQVMNEAAKSELGAGHQTRELVERFRMACAMRNKLWAHVVDGAGRPGLAALLAVVIRGMEPGEGGIKKLKDALGIVSRLLDDATSRQAA